MHRLHIGGGEEGREGHVLLENRSTIHLLMVVIVIERVLLTRALCAVVGGLVVVVAERVQ